MCLLFRFTTLQIHCFEGVFFSSLQLIKKIYIVCIELYTLSQAFLHFYNGALCIMYYGALGEEHFFELIVKKIFLFCI